MHEVLVSTHLNVSYQEIRLLGRGAFGEVRAVPHACTFAWGCFSSWGEKSNHGAYESRYLRFYLPGPWKLAR